MDNALSALPATSSTKMESVAKSIETVRFSIEMLEYAKNAIMDFLSMTMVLAVL